MHIYTCPLHNLNVTFRHLKRAQQDQLEHFLETRTVQTTLPAKLCDELQRPNRVLSFAAGATVWATVGAGENGPASAQQPAAASQSQHGHGGLSARTKLPQKLLDQFDLVISLHDVANPEIDLALTDPYVPCAR